MLVTLTTQNEEPHGHPARRQGSWEPVLAHVEQGGDLLPSQRPFFLNQWEDAVAGRPGPWDPPARTQWTACASDHLILLGPRPGATDKVKVEERVSQGTQCHCQGTHR